MNPLELPTINGWKLFKVRRDGTIGPLFINPKLIVVPGLWYEAEDHPTKGFAHRPGWHAALKPEAPHLKLTLASGQCRRWFPVELQGYRYYPVNKGQGDLWVLASRLRVLEEVH